MFAVSRDVVEGEQSRQKVLDLQSFGGKKQHDMRKLQVIYYGLSEEREVRSNRKWNRKERKQIVKGLIGHGKHKL